MDRSVGHAQVTSKPLGRQRCVHEYIEEQAAQHPERAAVSFAGHKLSYGELNARANQLAHHLQMRGVVPETIVALGTRRSDDLLVALVAIWKAGGAYVPLDLAFPRERLRYTVENAGARLLITHQALVPLWADFPVDTVLIDRDWASISRQPSTNLQPSADADSLAQLLYTSGSTGHPKGVELCHRGLANFVEHMKIEPGMAPVDRVLASTSVGSDTSGVELFTPLAIGAEIIMLADGQGQGTKEYLRFVEQQDITILQGTPTALRWFTEFGWSGKPDMKIISGGEALSRELAEKLIPLCSELWNIYGPTETTIWSTLTRVEHGQGPVPIGHAISNTQIYLLNSELQPVHADDPGEVCIGGVGVARGYRNMPEATAERFADFPGAGARIYRTGDLGKRLPSGDYGFLGRLDHQIKVNGLRIEPEEVEAAIVSYPGVRQCLVMGREDESGDQRVVAYVVMNEGVALNTRGLREHLLRTLLPPMIPTHFVVIPSMPRLISGKVDRSKLPDPRAATGKTAI